MDIAFRVDGGSEIGMGHVIRCLELAKMLRQYNNVFFVCRFDNEISSKYAPGISIIKNNGFNVEIINEKKLYEDIKKLNADCIITDSYDVDEKYFEILKSNFKYSGCFDDECMCSYFNVDFLINQNFYAKELNYKINQNTKMILGSKYIILRDEFRKNNEEKIISKEIRDIMLTVGGSDNNNNTEKIIKQFLNSNYKVHIVVGNGFTNVEKFKKYRSENVKIYFDANMKKLMSMCDICISSCGTTIYELISMGIPTIAITVAENQKMLYNYIKKNFLAEVSEIDTVYEKIKTLTYDKRKQLNSRMKNIVDGKGVVRMSFEIEKKLKGVSNNEYINNSSTYGID
ncbi:UDP-2,4-diacetamido-2,4,6-trideoxy-beta-L-altropyranose hydrolase [Clostridium botulinum]|nr:UDP-2,4-diacetamido-2,4,6-trideoxy-beta-L-altropyranose hydrolase [Clostridium botulinum]